MEFSIKKDGKRIVIICAAALVMAVNLKTFVHTGNLFPGGATGLTILIQRSAKQFFGVNLPFSVINLLLNAFPIYIGFRYIGKKFTLGSCLMIVLSSVLTDLIPPYVITEDILLISIFGGIINGAVIGLALMANANTGGTDFIAVYLFKKKGIDGWNFVLILNAGILLIAGLLFGWDRALYSIIFQFASTQVVHMLYQKYKEQTLFIVTQKAQSVCEAIRKTCNHSATIIPGEGSFVGVRYDVVYSVISRPEYKDVIEAVKKADPKAFINSMKTDRLTGRFYRKPEE